MPPRSRLRDVMITGIHIVDKGDNPEARFAMYKSADDVGHRIDTPEAAYVAIKKLAATGGTSFAAALRSEAGQRIYQRSQELYADREPPELRKSRTGADGDFDYLRKTAEAISFRDGISVEKAYTRIRHEKPEEAERYRRETR